MKITYLSKVCYYFYKIIVHWKCYSVTSSEAELSNVKAWYFKKSMITYLTGLLGFWFYTNKHIICFHYFV